jgi:TonB family protein
MRKLALFVFLCTILSALSAQQAAPPRVTGAKLLQAIAARYPSEMLGTGENATVELEAKINERGMVTSCTVLSGPEGFHRAAQRAVLDWQFDTAPAVARISMDFQPPAMGENGVARIVGIELDSSVTPADQTALRSRLQPFQSVPATEEMQRAMQAVVGSSGGYQVRFDASPNSKDKLARVSKVTAETGAPVITIPAADLAARLVHCPAPVYPAEAISARIQGTVNFEVVVAADGSVKSLRLISGHPLLVRAAVDSIRNNRYRPTADLGPAVSLRSQASIDFRLPNPQGN